MILRLHPTSQIKNCNNNRTGCVECSLFIRWALGFGLLYIHTCTWHDYGMDYGKYFIGKNVMSVQDGWPKCCFLWRADVLSLTGFLFYFKVVLSQNCVTFIVLAPDVHSVRFINLSLVTFLPVWSCCCFSCNALWGRSVVSRCQRVGSSVYLVFVEVNPFCPVSPCRLFANWDGEHPQLLYFLLVYQT